MSGIPTFCFEPFSSSPLRDHPEATLIVFVDEAMTPATETACLLAGLDWPLLRRAAGEEGFRGKSGESMALLAGQRRLVLVGTDGGNPHPFERGREAAEAAGYGGSLIILWDLPSGQGGEKSAAAEMALGFRLGCYRFDTYRTRRRDPTLPENRVVTILAPFPEEAASVYALFEAPVAEGVELARSLVNEPANVLTPTGFARRVQALRETGLDVEIIGEAELEKRGFQALLGVGKGSCEESHVAILRWTGAADATSPPLAFIGKGVCFDAGGLSIKSAEGMADMKGDMAGAACVTGLMLALARRKASVNAIGAIGLVENMPGGGAQRPGDIVRSLSGQTIEIIDTDYEGRLVLADLLWHVQERFQPRFMIDLATLTHDIVVGIGLHRAGLFCNDDALAARLEAAASSSGERVWRMPMDPEFDEAMDSPIADMRNMDSPHGGACTAASFIQRFVNGVPWVHLDISGPAHALPDPSPGSGWATGWGVRLLDRLVRTIEAEDRASAPAATSESLPEKRSIP